MPEPFELKINEADLRRFRETMTRLSRAGHDLGPAMKLVAATLLDETEANFEDEGRPDWPDLAEATIAARTRAGTWPGKKEQVSGQLAASTHTEFGPTFAQIGQAKVYAAIQNLGGEAGRGRQVTLPPRPSLPITPDGGLQPEAEQAVLEAVLDYLAKLAVP